MKRLKARYRNEAGLAQLEAAVVAARHTALEAALGVVNSRRYASMLIDLPMMLDTGAWRKPATAEAPAMPVGSLAVRQLQKR